MDPDREYDTTRRDKSTAILEGTNGSHPRPHAPDGHIRSRYQVASVQSATDLDRCASVTGSSPRSSVTDLIGVRP